MERLRVIEMRLQREREREGETETQKDSKALTRRVGGGSPRQEEKAVGQGE